MTDWLRTLSFDDIQNNILNSVKHCFFEYLDILSFRTEPSYFQYTALHVAVMHNQPVIVELLLDKGAGMILANCLNGIGLLFI